MVTYMYMCMYIHTSDIESPYIFSLVYDPKNITRRLKRHHLMPSKGQLAPRLCALRALALRVRPGLNLSPAAVQ